MADYISTLTGAQMDASLLDMAEHTSEAYAVGERNGIAVGSDDVTYHNNARYYAQQAQSIAPASVTEAVRWDVAQTALTDANREMGRTNIRATSHNTNLLDNAWWGSGELINQRGVTTLTSGYVFDRWAFETSAAGNTASVTSNGISFTYSGSGYFDVYQTLSQNLHDYINNKVVTASVLLSDGTIIKNSNVIDGSGTVNLIQAASGVNVIYQGSTYRRLYIRPYQTMTIRAVKIEVGSFSTIEYDTPPEQGEELTRCIYSTASPTDTYANNGFGRTNPNLLDNPFFTVHQIGTSGHTGVGYGVDRWKIRSGAGCTVTPRTNYGITVSYTTSFDITQCLWVMPAVLANKTYTLSVLANGELLSASGIITTANQYYFGVQSSTNNYRCRIGSSSAIGSGNLYINIEPTNSSGTLNIDAVKLELGTVSTLANDVPPDYGTELAKCMHYFQRIKATAGYAYLGTGAGFSTTLAYFIVNLPVPLRTTSVTTSLNGTFSVQVPGSFSDASAYNFYFRTPSIFMVNITASGMTAGQACLLTLKNSGDYIDISADL